MIITIWVDGQNYEMPDEQVIPWICGLHGSLDSVDLGLDHPITVDVDPEKADFPGISYIIEFDGVRRELAEHWVLPWMRGLAIRHGIADRAVCDPSAARRAQIMQTLMVGHEFGLFVYLGFTKRETS